MLNEHNEELLAQHAAKLKQLFGPAPVLSSENPDLFDELLVKLLKCFTPEDFLLQTLTWELAVQNWEIARGTRHKTLVIERRFRQRLKFQEQRAKLLAKRKAGIVAAPAAANGERVSDGQRLVEIRANIESLVDDADEILDRAPAEQEHAWALERSMNYYERLDDRVGIAIRRRNAVLEQFEIYRTGLGQRLRQAADAVIEAEYKELPTPEAHVLAPPVVPNDGDTP